MLGVDILSNMPYPRPKFSYVYFLHAKINDFSICSCLCLLTLGWSKYVSNSYYQIYWYCWWSQFSIKKNAFKIMASAKWWPFCVGLVLAWTICALFSIADLLVCRLAVYIQLHESCDCHTHPLRPPGCLPVPYGIVAYIYAGMQSRGRGAGTSLTSPSARDPKTSGGLLLLINIFMLWPTDSLTAHLTPACGFIMMLCKLLI